MKVIGVIGQNGSGKDEVLKYLRARQNIPFLSTGDMVREIAAKEGKEPTRENLQDISERYFREFGRGCFVKLVAEKIQQNGWKLCGITGIRSLEDVKILKDIFGKDFILINVYVSQPEIRFKRMVQRGEGRDPHSYEQFLRQDKTEEELFHIQSAVQYANYSISNDGTLDDLYKEIDKLVSEKGLLSL
ncbi:MAG: AAA family ATPase [Dehalococcoidales bacterium]|nr:AAA family ATPase [Dehalococcoidales bacterium]